MKNYSTLKSLQQPHLQQRAANLFTMMFGVTSLVLVLLLLPFNCVGAVGYSYTRFVGPVTGPERKIFVNDAISSSDGSAPTYGSGAPHFDYIGKPEYEFAYGVEDADAHILHNRNEMRDGDAVKGVYSLIDPDGTLRVVKYTADEINGFQAEVIRNGVSSLHDQLQHDYIHAQPSKIVHNNHYNPHSQITETYFNGDRTVAVYPSSNTYKSNVVQLPPNMRHETPPQLPIIYYYHKNYSDENDDGSADREGGQEGDGAKDYDGRGDENEDQQPHYEVREKHEEDADENQEHQDQRPQYKVHEKPDEGAQENQDDDCGHKSKSRVKVTTHKNRKQPLNEEEEVKVTTHKNRKQPLNEEEEVKVTTHKNRKQPLNEEEEVKVTTHKNRKQHLDEDEEEDDEDEDEDEDYDEVHDSEEEDDYDDSVHATHNSEESYEYY